MPLSPHTFDQLTGLPAQAHLLAQLERAHQAMVERRLGFAVLAVAPHDEPALQHDMDGDAIALGLLGMAQVFRDSLRHSDGVGHLGNGRFLAYATQLRSEADTLALAQRIHDRLRWSFVGSGHASGGTRVPISMGVSLRLPCMAEGEAADLVHEALQALALAQQSNGGALRLFTAPEPLSPPPSRLDPLRPHGGQRRTDSEPWR
ncbi:MAG TPA: diguanylate cyclase [Dehalococcoidia bacterium]|nr:diguanylate cyclase [Dehalococcoidia bacterium]